jgi:hypothetical protein
MASFNSTSSRIDKVEAIRQHLAVNPRDSATEVIRALTRLGVAASPDLVQEIRKEMAIETGEREEAAQREPAPPKPDGAASQPRREHLLRDKASVDDLAAARDFVAQLGGVDRARQALDEWANLQRHASKPR